MILKFIYTLFIGVLFATLVGVGIAAFYSGPTMPDYPSGLSYPAKPVQNAAETKKMEEQQIKYDKAIKVYDKQNKLYSRNVSIFALVFAIAALVVSLTLLYSIIRGFSTDDNMFRFIVVAIGFIIALAIGYIKFTKPAQKKK